MSAGERNRLRARAVAVSRMVKAVLRPAPVAPVLASIGRAIVTVLLGAIGGPGRARRAAYRWAFTADGHTLRRAGEVVLADLRDFCGVQKPGFSSDALVMARREGRREVFLRIANYLNLDEAAVQQLMEIDDGI